MGRKKAVMHYKNWEDVDQGLRRLGEIDIQVEKLEGEMTLRINELKAQFETKASGLKAERKQVEDAISQYATEHKDEFTKDRTRSLAFGTISFRIVKSIRITGVKACLAAMKALGLGDYIRTKEQPDKEAMTALDDNTLAKVNAKRQITDKIRIEPNMERIGEVA